MRFEEFRSLIEERRELYFGLDKCSTSEEKTAKFNRILEIDQNLFPEENIKSKYKKIGNYSLYLESMKSKIYFIFEVGRDNLINMLRSFFNGNNLKFNILIYTEFPEGIQITTEKNSYNLGYYNHLLYCLCTYGKEDWDVLLKDYPDLIDHLWNEFKALKNKNKEEEIRLVKKMINKNQKEKRILTVPMFRENRIHELDTERDALKDKLSNLKESLDQINI